jgi:hypothetical protein
MRSPDESDVSQDILHYRLSTDNNGKLLKGEKTYCFKLPFDKPVCKYWSVIVYDARTHLVIHTDQLWPSVFSSCKKLALKDDGSVHIWFSPNAPVEPKLNWIRTISKNGWYMILRFYEPVPEWLTKSWKPGEIEEVKKIIVE